MNQHHQSFSAVSLLLAICTLAAPPVWATGDHGAHGQVLAQASTADMADGEVRKVDKDSGKLTLKHGEIRNLDMPPMTMVFVVKDKALLDSVKAGDKVRFKAINDGGKYTVVELQAVQ